MKKKILQLVLGIWCITLYGCGNVTSSREATTDTLVVQEVEANGENELKSNEEERGEEISSEEAGEEETQTGKEFREDAMAFIQTLEETHPAFALDAVPAEYEQRKREYLQVVADTTISRNQFIMETRKLVAVFQDIHTYLAYDEDYDFTKDWIRVVDDKLVIEDEETKEQLPVLRIGGKEAGELMDGIDLYYPYENEIGHAGNRDKWMCCRMYLDIMGCVSDESGIEYVVLQNGEEKVRKTAWMNTAECAIPKDVEERANMTSEILTDDLLHGEILYVDWNSCMLNDNEYYKNTRFLSKALRDGVHKVILDMRDNGGGNAYYCEDYLERLGMKLPEYESITYYSPLLVEHMGKGEVGKIETQKRATYCAKPNPDIQLVVLTNENTFSAATILGVYVQDGKLGTIIGSPSSNSPNCYCSVVDYEMKNSKINVAISTNRLERPDKNADPDVLVPDMEVPEQEDALEFAIGYLEALSSF